MKQSEKKKSGFIRTQQQQGGLKGRLQIFELKQLADMEAQYKQQCRQSLASYKAWCQKHAGETDMIELLYGNLEGVMLRRRAEDAVEAYWVIRQDFRCLFKDYLEKSCCYPPTYLKSAAA